MAAKDRRIDAYIDKAADFAKPILRHLRNVVHAACPDVEETLKWGTPSFEYRGMLCGMSAFQEHCAFGFWKGELVLRKGSPALVSQFGRITSIDDLPSEKTLAGLVKKAMKLNEDGVKAPHMINRRSRPPLEPPDDFLKALKKSKPALTAFENFSPSHKREYVAWILEAKTDSTREKRLATALEWISEGKPRNWKYMR